MEGGREEGEGRKGGEGREGVREGKKEGTRAKHLERRVT